MIRSTSSLSEREGKSTWNYNSLWSHLLNPIHYKWVEMKNTLAVIRGREMGPYSKQDLKVWNKAGATEIFTLNSLPCVKTKTHIGYSCQWPHRLSLIADGWKLWVCQINSGISRKWRNEGLWQQKTIYLAHILVFSIDLVSKKITFEKQIWYMQLFLIQMWQTITVVFEHN